MGSKSKKQVVGYKYFMSLHMGFCRGPINAITQIMVGQKVIWPTLENYIDQGDVVDNTDFVIDQPNAFGGDSGEGGIVGTFTPLFGRIGQTLSATMQGLLGASTTDGRVSNYIGVVSAFFSGFVCSNNPYPKEWKVRMYRNTEGWAGGTAWYAAQAEIPMRGGLIGQIDFDGGNATPGGHITINGNSIFFVAGTGDLLAGQVRIGSDTATTAGNLNAYINVYGGSLGVRSTVVGSFVTVTTINPESTLTLTSTGPYPTVVASTSAPMIHAMNPAHILYEISTNPVWGRGLDPSFLDDAKWRAAADQLSTEGFGLCLKWQRSDNLTSFASMVINHIGGALYVDRTTGLLTLTLIRGDYDPNALQVFTYDTGLLSIEGDDANSADTNYNEVIVNWHDPIQDTDRQARVHNLAGIQSTAQLISNTVDYKGVPTADLALRLAERDLTIQANWLKRLKITLDRRAWSIPPAGVFRIQAPDRNISNMILRASKIEVGPLPDGKVVITALQDVFGLPATSFNASQPVSWFKPNRSALPVASRRVTEAAYRDLFLNNSPGDFAAITATDCAVMIFAAKPTSLSQSYELMTHPVGSDYVDAGVGHFTPSFTLAAAVGVYETLLLISNVQSFDNVVVGGAAEVDGEVMQIIAFDLVANTMTVGRGCQDTVPAPHAAGATGWAYDLGASTDSAVYSTGEEVFVKLLTKTSSDTLAIANAPEDTVTMAGRFFRPYPPGNLQIGGTPFGNVAGVRFHASGAGIAFTWAHRDRLIEQDNLSFDHFAGDIGPEAGTTYNVRVYQAGVLVRTVAGIVGNTWTYTPAMWATDGKVQNTEFQLESSRDGVVSWQLYDFTIAIYGASGWGYNWGRNWGRSARGWGSTWGYSWGE